METLRERISFIRNEVLHLKQDAFADVIGRHVGKKVTRGAAGNWEYGGGIKPEFAKAICEIAGCSMDWLLRGIGEAPEKRPKPSKRIRIIEPDFSSEPDSHVESGVDGDIGRKSRLNSILEIDVRAGAGGGGMPIARYVLDENGNSFAAEGIRDEWRLPETIMKQELHASATQIRIFEVIGDSMQPVLFERDRVFIDTRLTEPHPPGIFALWDGDGLVIKRLQFIHRSEPPRVRIISVNKDYDPYEALISEIRIVGRLVGRFTTTIST